MKELGSASSAADRNHTHVVAEVIVVQALQELGCFFIISHLDELYANLRLAASRFFQQKNNVLEVATELLVLA